MEPQLPLRLQEILSTCIISGTQSERRTSKDDPNGATRLLDASNTLGSRIATRNPDSDGMVRSMYHFVKCESALYKIENKAKALIFSKVMRAALDYKTLFKPRDDMNSRNMEETNQKD